MGIEELTVFDIALVPVIIGLVAVATTLGLAKRFAPLLSLMIGVVMGLTLVAPDNPSEGVIVGIAMGLASVGLYSGTKNTIQNKERS